MIYQCSAIVQYFPYYGDPVKLKQEFLIEASDEQTATSTIYKFYEKQSANEGEQFTVLTVSVAISLNSADYE